jgi:hypothetical protein
MRNAIAALAFAAASLMVAPACADDFVFNVPVRIENAQMITAAQVECVVIYERGSPGPGFASAMSTVTVPDGGYNGTVVVTVTPPPEARRQDAQEWRCTLGILLAPTPATATWLGASLTDEARSVRYTAATGRLVTSSHSQERAMFSR